MEHVSDGQIVAPKGSTRAFFRELSYADYFFGIEFVHDLAQGFVARQEKCIPFIRR